MIIGAPPLGGGQVGNAIVCSYDEILEKNGSAFSGSLVILAG
jgi:hypothetical protein